MTDAQRLEAIKRLLDQVDRTRAPMTSTEHVSLVDLRVKYIHRYNGIYTLVDEIRELAG